eukprot:Clim_evm8s196 gene=Clim_evmTU8s196
MSNNLQEKVDEAVAHPGQEVQLGPGIFFTSFKNARPTCGSQAQPHHVPNEQLAHQSREWLLQEFAHLKNQLQHLERSNRELMEADPNDPEFKEAVAENAKIMKDMEIRKKMVSDILGRTSSVSQPPSEHTAPAAGPSASSAMDTDVPTSRTEPESAAAQEGSGNEGTENDEGIYV